MKKNLFLALALAAPVMAGVDAPVVVAPNPETVATPAPVVSPWALEIGAVHRWATEDIIKDFSELGEIDLWGADMTLIYKVDDNHSFNLRVGYNYGDASISDLYDDGVYYDYEKAKYEVHNFYIMPGYRYTGSICDSASWYVGANVGASNLKIKEKYTFIEKENGVPTDECESDNTSIKDWGLAASAEIGLQYHITDAVYLYGAYQYWMSTAEASNEYAKSEKQHYHSVTAGIGINF